MMQKNNVISIEEEARELQRQYTREYRQQHPEKVKAWNHAYWIRKAQQQSADRSNGSKRKD